MNQIQNSNVTIIKRHFIKAALTFFSCILIISKSDAQTFFPVGDTYISNDTDLKSTNWGVSDQLIVRVKLGEAKSGAFLKFDINNVDPSKFVSATLRIYLLKSSGQPTNIGIHEVTQTWKEGAGEKDNTSIALENEVTWYNQPTIKKNPMIYINPGQSDRKWIEIEITQIVKGWLSDNSNHGISLFIDKNNSKENSGTYIFCSNEYSESTFRPNLIIKSNTTTQGLAGS